MEALAEQSPGQAVAGDVDMSTQLAADVLGQGASLLGNGESLGPFDPQSDQAFCDALDAFNWSGDIDGLLREEDQYTANKAGLDDAMADTCMDMLSDVIAMPTTEASPLEGIVLTSQPTHSDSQLMLQSAANASTASAAAGAPPAPSPCPTPSASPQSASGERATSCNTSSQESSDASKLEGGVRKVPRKMRSAHSSRANLAAEGVERVAAQQREQAVHLEAQRQQVEQQQAQLRVQQAELQAQQYQLHRDYMAMQLGSGPPAGPIGSARSLSAASHRYSSPDLSALVKPDPEVALKQSYAAGNAGRAAGLRSGSALGDLAASGTSGASRESGLSSQFQYNLSQQASEQPSSDAAAAAGAMASASPQLPGQPSAQPQQLPSQHALRAPAGFMPGPTHDADPLMMMGWQPRPPSFYNAFSAGSLAGYPGMTPDGLQPAPALGSEASMLGELKTLIGQLDQRTKATMKESLYRISRHAQGATSPKVRQAAVARSAAPQPGFGTNDDIGPVDRAVADLLYHDPAQRMQPFAAAFVQPGAPKMRMVPQQPAASEQASAPSGRRSMELAAGTGHRAAVV